MNRLKERAEAAINEDQFGAYTGARDLALVAMLYYAAVLGAEVLRHRPDERDGHQGLRWGRVNLDAGTMRILGKGQSWETAPIPSPALRSLRGLKEVQRPASDDWPVFATSHAPSKWKAAREQLGADVDALVEDCGSIYAVLGEYDIVPSALTTDGARSVLKWLTEAAGIDVDEGYLQPHGARRGMIGEVYKRDRSGRRDRESTNPVSDENTLSDTRYALCMQHPTPDSISVVRRDSVAYRVCFSSSVPTLSIGRQPTAGSSNCYTLPTAAKSENQTDGVA